MKKIILKVMLFCILCLFLRFGISLASIYLISPTMILSRTDSFAMALTNFINLFANYSWILAIFLFFIMFFKDIKKFLNNTKQK